MKFRFSHGLNTTLFVFFNFDNVTFAKQEAFSFEILLKSISFEWNVINQIKILQRKKFHSTKSLVETLFSFEASCINISGKPFRNKHVTFKEKYLNFIFVNSSSEDCVQHRHVYSMFRLRTFSGLLHGPLRSQIGRF